MPVKEKDDLGPIVNAINSILKESFAHRSDEVTLGALKTLYNIAGKSCTCAPLVKGVDVKKAKGIADTIMEINGK